MHSPFSTRYTMEMHHHYSMLPPPRRATRESTYHHTAVVAILPSNTVGHNMAFLPNASILWNELPEKKVGIRERDKFKTEINAFLASALAPSVERDSCSVKEEAHIKKIIIKVQLHYKCCLLSVVKLILPIH